MYQFIKITIDDRIYYFSKPHHLFHEGKLYKLIHGSQLAWKIKNKLITYNKLKNYDNNRKNIRDS